MAALKPCQSALLPSRSSEEGHSSMPAQQSRKKYHVSSTSVRRRAHISGQRTCSVSLYILCPESRAVPPTRTCLSRAASSSIVVLSPAGGKKQNESASTFTHTPNNATGNNFTSKKPKGYMFLPCQSGYRRCPLPSSTNNTMMSTVGPGLNSRQHQKKSTPRVRLDCCIRIAQL